jgi:hypothetical protein
MVHFHHKDLYNYLIILFKLQEVLRWIQGVVKEIGTDVSTEKLKEFVWKTLKSGKVRRNNSKKEITYKGSSKLFLSLVHSCAKHLH